MNTSTGEGKPPQTRKGIDMTYKDALNFAIDTLNNSTADNTSEVIEKLEKMIAQLENHHKGASEEAKAKQNAKRKEATANARAVLVNKVAPILRRFMTEDKTVKQIFAEAQVYLPEDFTAAKVQNILTREMSPEIIKTERKGGKPNLYRLANVENDDSNQYLPNEIAV